MRSLKKIVITSFSLALFICVYLFLSTSIQSIILWDSAIFGIITTAICLIILLTSVLSNTINIGNESVYKAQPFWVSWFSTFIIGIYIAATSYFNIFFAGFINNFKPFILIFQRLLISIIVLTIALEIFRYIRHAHQKVISFKTKELSELIDNEKYFQALKLAKALLKQTSKDTNPALIINLLNYEAMCYYEISKTTENGVEEYLRLGIESLEEVLRLLKNTSNFANVKLRLADFYYDLYFFDPDIEHLKKSANLLKESIHSLYTGANSDELLDTIDKYEKIKKLIFSHRGSN